MKPKLQLYFTNVGEQILLDKVSFTQHDTSPNIKPTSEMNSVSSGVQGCPTFRWDPGERALCVLFLRAGATETPSKYSLKGSLARSLAEVLGDKHAKDKPEEPTWIQTMFRGYQSAKNDIATKQDPRLPASFFTRQLKPTRNDALVWLGRDWAAATMEVFMDGKNAPEPRESYAKYADVLEGGARSEHLEVGVEVLVASADDRELAEFRPLAPNLVPVRAGQLLRISITLSRRAFLYVLWITPKGLAEPNYPWKPNHWDELAVEAEEKQQILELPPTPPGTERKAWRFEKIRGLETLVVLGREKKMPPEVREELRAQLLQLPAPRPQMKIAPGPFGFDLRNGAPLSTRLDYREVPVTDPVRERHLALAARLGPRCDVGRCISFLNCG